MDFPRFVGLSFRERMVRGALDQHIQNPLDGLKRLPPQEIIEYALAAYSPAISIAFSGAEDVVLIDMASKLGRPFRVFCLDTGRLHSETYRFLETVRNHYRIEIDLLFPQPAAVEQLVREKGLFSFYRDGHKECCAIRKVEPLRRALAGLNAWITGQRKDQSPSTRSDVPVTQTDTVTQADTTFGSTDKHLIKFNPLSNWTSKQVWNYIRQDKVPYNVLHEQGFVSIGCEPCTRPILPNQHEREGRWWWEEETKKECGLHAGNVSEF